MPRIALIGFVVVSIAAVSGCGSHSPAALLGLTLDQIFQVRVHPTGRKVAVTAGQPRTNVWALDNALRRR